MSNLDLDKLTRGSIEGQGTFDTLMRAVSSHLASQFDGGKITGSDYANVYLNTISTTLNQSVQFLLGAEQLKYQVLLLQAQIEATKTNTDLIKAQIRKMDADTNVSVKQLDVMDKEISQLMANTLLTNKQIENVTKDIQVKTAQINQAEAQTSLVQQQRENAVKENTVITNQGTKVAAETLLLEQKKVTEEAQTQGNKDTVHGLLGSNMLLLHKQAEGFDRNAEQKLAKMLIDTWTVRQSTDGALVNTNGLADSEINKVLNKAKEGIGVTPFN